jgi:hypothetical protein
VGMQCCGRQGVEMGIEPEAGVPASHHAQKALGDLPNHQRLKSANHSEGQQAYLVV